MMSNNTNPKKRCGEKITFVQEGFLSGLSEANTTPVSERQKRNTAVEFIYNQL